MELQICLCFTFTNTSAQSERRYLLHLMENMVSCHILSIYWKPRDFVWFVWLKVQDRYDVAHGVLTRPKALVTSVKWMKFRLWFLDLLLQDLLQKSNATDASGNVILSDFGVHMQQKVYARFKPHTNGFLLVSILDDDRCLKSSGNQSILLKPVPTLLFFAFARGSTCYTC